VSFQCQIHPFFGLLAFTVGVIPIPHQPIPTFVVFHVFVQLYVCVCVCVRTPDRWILAVCSLLARAFSVNSFTHPLTPNLACALQLTAEEVVLVFPPQVTFTFHSSH